MFSILAVGAVRSCDGREGPYRRCTVSGFFIVSRFSLRYVTFHCVAFRVFVTVRALQRTFRELLLFRGLYSFSRGVSCLSRFVTLFFGAVTLRDR